MVKLCLANCLGANTKEIDGSLTHDLISTDTILVDYELLNEEYILKWSFLIYHSSQLLLNRAFFSKVFRLQYVKEENPVMLLWGY